MLKGFTIARDVPAGHYPLRRVFAGVGRSPALRLAIPDAERRREILRAARVEVNVDVSYMRVSDEDGRVMVGYQYLRSGPEREIYLDLVHELTHVRQFLDGANLYDRSVPYVDRPTEIEAYTVAVAEARRIGFTPAEIHAYLDVHWMSEDERLRLARHLGVEDLPVTG